MFYLFTLNVVEIDRILNINKHAVPEITLKFISWYLISPESALNNTR